MARLRTRVERAAVLHRQAAAAIAATASAVDGYSPSSAPAEQYAEQHELAARLRSAAADLVPGWLGSGLDAVSAATPAGGTGVPAFLRLGMAHPLDDAAFPAIAPLFGTGHLAIDADARDPRVAGLLRSVLLRLVAAAIPGALHIRVIDAAGEGDTIAAFAGLPNLPPPITDHPGMQSVLIEADQWIRNTPPRGAAAPSGVTPPAAQSGITPPARGITPPAKSPAAAPSGGTPPAKGSPAGSPSVGSPSVGSPQPTGNTPPANPTPANATSSTPWADTRPPANIPGRPTAADTNPAADTPETTSPDTPPERYFVLVIASLPELTDGNDLARIAHLARTGVAHRLHLIVAGWPPPPLTAETTQAPLPFSTQVSLRNPYVWVGDPPGATYSGSGVGPARLNAPVYLDPEPPADVIRRVCAELAAQEPGGVEPPTWAPSAQRWGDYIRAAQRLDAARRQAAKVVTEQTAAVKRVRAELSTARRQVAIQQNRISDLVRDGQPVPLRPTATDLGAAEAALGRLAQAASQRATAARSALTTPTGGYPTVTGSIPTGGVMNPGTGTGGFPVVTPRPGPAPHPPATSGWAQPAAYGRTPAAPGPVQVTSPPRPVSGPAYPPVSGPGGHPPVSGVPNPLHVNTGSFPTVHSGAFPVVSAPPGTGLHPPAPSPVNGPANAPASAPAMPVPAGPPSANPRLPEAAMTMIGEARATLQRADAELSDIDARIKRSPGARNGIIYFSYAVLFALAQVPLLFMLLLGDGVTPLAVVPCAVMLIFLSFALAWLTIGVAYREPSGQRPRRTPALGLVISLIAATPAFVSTFWTVFFD